MKKIISIMLCLFLMGIAFCGTVLSVNAAGNAHMSIGSSSGTLYRGDSFTLTVSLSNDQPIGNGGVILKFDSNVFEFVGGQCQVSNATLAEVSAAKGGGVFVLQTDSVVSGAIFTINMRVKDSAPFGSYTISGTPSLNIPCTLSGTGVTVACKHSYGNYANVDAGNHERICSVCGDKLAESHTWDGGTVISAANCKDTGIKKLTCTACGATAEEVIPTTDVHVYQSWAKVNATAHTSTCTVCGNVATRNHTWNGGTVTEKPTCQNTGTRLLTCTACNATKTETVAKANHAYSDWTSADNSSHKQICKDCGNESIGTHTYGTTLEHDETQHFLSCTACGHKSEQAAHVPGPKATETTDQICTVCNRILKPMGAHVHSFAQAWTTDQSSHWHVCSDCPEKDSFGTHEYDSVCDTDCNVCGIIREPIHAPAKEWSSDATGHWYSCENCKEKLNFTAHTPGAEATITAPQTCTVCAFEVAPVVPHDHVFDAQGTLHSHICICGESYDVDAKDCTICTTFPWWIVCIAEAVVFCGILVGGYFWMKKRETGKAQTEQQES